MSLLFLLACASEEPAWAVLHASVVPDAGGMVGTQTWEFFSAAWSPDAGDQGYLCARVQTLTGTLSASPACPDCRAVWALEVEELDGDCDETLAQSKDFGGPALYAVGEVATEFAAREPWPGEGFGWAVGFGDGELIEAGYAYAEALDLGEVAPPGLAQGEAYTLWPAIAWAQ